MKNGITLLFLVLLFSCKSTNKPESVVLNAEDVQKIVSVLASDDFQGRRAGFEGIEKAARYIEQKFQSYGVKPYFETYRDSFKIDSLDAFNVVGFIEGHDKVLKKEIIIIGAHYDHIGYGESIEKFGGKLVEKDSIANGANDNASGTSAVLAMAKYFATKKSNKRSIMFALFSGEESRLIGSKHLAKRLYNEKIDLYTMINFEMIGVPLKNKDYQVFASGYDRSNMAHKINEYAKSNLVGFSEVSKKFNLFTRSDNYAFYKQFRVPCQSLSSCDLSNYNYYHHVSDEAQLMDYGFMTNFMNSIIPAIEMMSNTSSKEIEMYQARSDE